MTDYFIFFENILFFQGKFFLNYLVKIHFLKAVQEGIEISALLFYLIVANLSQFDDFWCDH